MLVWWHRQIALEANLSLLAFRFSHPYVFAMDAAIFLDLFCILIVPIWHTDIDVQITHTDAYFMSSDVVERQTLAKIGTDDMVSIRLVRRC